MGTPEFQHYVYTDEQVAKAKAESMKEEWTSYKVKEVKVRVISENEGAIGHTLVQIRRSTWTDWCRETALKKLTADEKAALGLGTRGFPV
jgi:hypothetical protein